MFFLSYLVSKFGTKYQGACVLAAGILIYATLATAAFCKLDKQNFIETIKLLTYVVSIDVTMTMFIANWSDSTAACCADCADCLPAPKVVECLTDSESDSDSDSDDMNDLDLAANTPLPSSPELSPTCLSEFLE